MAVRIRSLATAGPVLVPLNTGASVRLSPGQVSEELADVEVAANAKVDKLRERGLIDVEQDSEQADDQADTAEEETAGEPRSRGRKRTASSG